MGVLDRIAKAVAVGVQQSRAAVETKTFGGGRSLASWSRDQWLEVGQRAPDVHASAVAYRCIESIASNGSSLPLALRNPDTDEPMADPFLALWNKTPNPYMSARVMAQGLWWRLQTRGEWFAYLDRGQSGTGQVQGIYPLIDADVELIAEGSSADPWSSAVLGYKIERGDRKVTLLPSEVLWVRYPDPDVPLGVISPLRAAANALSLDAEARAYQSSTFLNADRPGGVLYLGDVDEDTHRTVEANLIARHSGAGNSGRTLLLSGPVPSKYERFALTAEEVGYLDTRVRSAEEVMLAFGVPRDYLMGGATYENRAAAKTTLWSDKILPDADLIASEIDHQVFPAVNAECHFDSSHVDALRESQDAVVLRTSGLVTSDVVTLDEARQAIGLDPLPGGIGELTLTAYRLSLTGGAMPIDTAARSFEYTDLTGDVLHGVLAPPPAIRSADLLGPVQVGEVTDPLMRMGTAAAEAMFAAQQKVMMGNAQSLASGSRRARTRRQSLKEASVLERALSTDLTRGCEVVALEHLTPFVREAYKQGVSLYGDALSVHPVKVRKQVKKSVEVRLKALAQATTLTTQRALEAGFQEAIADDQQRAVDLPPPPQWMLDVINDVVSKANVERPETIAETETFSALNDSGSLVAEQANATGKTWRTMRDSKVRPSHITLEGVTVPVQAVFANGCAHPHDPNGRADEVINCRCWLEYDAPEPQVQEAGFAPGALRGHDGFDWIYDEQGDGLQYAGEDLQDLAGKVSSEWKSGDWRGVNRLLYEGKRTGHLDGYYYSDLSAYLEDLDEVWGTLPPVPADTVVTRSTSSSFESVGALLDGKKGDTFRSKGYLATTGGNVDDLYAMGLGGDVTMEILVKEGSRSVMSLDAMGRSGVNAEMELLIQRGAKMTLAEKPFKDASGTWILRLVLG